MSATTEEVYTLTEWYVAHEDAEDAISPLVSVLITAMLDAGYDKEYGIGLINQCWDVVEQMEADNAAKNS